MHTRKHIGVGVCAVDKPDYIGKDIISFKCLRPKVLTVWKYYIYGKADCKGAYEIPYIFLEFRYVLKEKINSRNNEKRIPQAVKYYEALKKRYIVIKEYV